MPYIDTMSQSDWFEIFKLVYSRRAVYFVVQLNEDLVTVELLTFLYGISTEIFYDLINIKVLNGKRELVYRIADLADFWY